MSKNSKIQPKERAGDEEIATKSPARATLRKGDLVIAPGETRAGKIISIVKGDALLEYQHDDGVISQGIHPVEILKKAN